MVSNGNQRLFKDQKLGVRLPDGTVEAIEDRFLSLAVINREERNNQPARVLDRGPATGLEIVEI